MVSCNRQQLRLRLLLLFLFLSGSAVLGRAQTITILSAQPDPAANELVLRGLTFPNGSRVFLFSDPVIELPVVSTTPSILRATLPAPMPRGTFLLLVLEPISGKYGFFDVSMRPAAGADVVVDANGRYIGEYEAGTDSVILRRTPEPHIRLGISPGGFRKGSDSLTLLHLDSACSSPHLDERLASFFYDQHALTMPDGSAPDPFGNTVWAPDRSKPLFVPTCNPTPPQSYYKNSTGECVVPSIGFGCGGAYRPAKAIDLSHFVPPFRIE